MATVTTPEEERTAAALVRPDADGLYEVIDGVRVELPPTSALAAVIATDLAAELVAFAKPRGLGRTVVEGLFTMPAPVNRNRRPDVAFVSCQRFPLGGVIPPRDNAWDVVPDLAVEVVSPTDHADDLLLKVEEYFRAGVRLV
jgi:Uma2 family endonuclease